MQPQAAFERPHQTFRCMRHALRTVCMQHLDYDQRKGASTHKHTQANAEVDGSSTQTERRKLG